MLWTERDVFKKKMINSALGDYNYLNDKFDEVFNAARSRVNQNLKNERDVVTQTAKVIIYGVLAELY